MTRPSPTLLTSALLLAGSALFATTAVAQPKKAPRMPPLLPINHDGAKIAYRLKLRPGVGTPGETLTVDINIAEILAAADPVYGTRKPIDDADFTVYMVSPTPEEAAPDGKAAKKKKASAPAPWVDGRKAFRLSDAGSYGVTFTPPTEGLYALHFRGSGGAAGELDAWSPVVPVGVWPIPDGAAAPALPAELETATTGNAAAGHVLCEELCRKDLAQAEPKGKTPRYLSSAFAGGLGDQALVQQAAGAGLQSLSPLQRNDLAFYMRSLHITIHELFPEMAHYMVGEFTINEHGIARLGDHGIQLKGKETTSNVFVVYKEGKKSSKLPELISVDDLVARDLLDIKDRIGYVIFIEVEGDPDIAEIAFALGPEPHYKIVRVIGRNGDNHRSEAFNEGAAAFEGQGEFNDPQSLKKGPKALRDRLVPYFLRAAELATMYYGAEREFTAFDGAFD